MANQACIYQLVAVGLIDRRIHKPHLASRIYECKVDAETGQVYPFKPMSPFCVVAEEYFVLADDWYVDNTTLKLRPKSEFNFLGSKKMQFIFRHLPVTHDVCEVVLSEFLGWKSRGITLPRVFQKVYELGMDTPLQSIVEIKDDLVGVALESLEKLKPKSIYIMDNWTHFREYYICRRDVQPNLRITFEVLGNIVTQVTGNWLLTRPDVDFIPLPFSVIAPMRVVCSEPVLLWCIDTDPQFAHTTQRLITQLTLPTQLMYPQEELILNPKHLIFRIMLVLCYNGRPVRRRRDARFQHPITKLSVALCNTPDMESDGDFFEQVMPRMYNGVQNFNYVVYQVIYHPPPNHYGRQKDMFNGRQHYSTVNASRIPDDVFRLRVAWDESVVKDNFTNPENLSLEVYVENFNIGVYGDESGVFRVLFT